MEKSESIAKLTLALSQARAEFPVIEKSRTANIPGRGYNYSDLATDILSVVIPVLSDHGLAITQGFEQGADGNDRLTTLLSHVSGEWIENSVRIPPYSKPQELGSIITYFRRYTICAMLAIQGDEDTDAQEPPVKERRPPVELASLVKPKEALKTPILTGWTPSKAQLTRLHTIAGANHWSSQMAKERLLEAYGKDSSKLLTQDQYNEFCAFIEAHPQSEFEADL